MRLGWLALNQCITKCKSYDEMLHTYYQSFVVYGLMIQTWVTLRRSLINFINHLVFTNSLGVAYTGDTYSHFSYGHSKNKIL